MRNLKLAVSAAFLAVTTIGSAHAAEVDLFGDIDCFGTNQVCNDGFRGAGTSADFFDFNAAMVPDATVPVTDAFNGGLVDGVSWTHSLSSLVGITGASLEFRTWALADQRGPYDVQVNGFSVGQVDIVDTGEVFSSQQVINHVFAVSTGFLQVGANAIDLVKLDGSGDNWALDYSSLSTESVAVPLPAALPLLAAALGGLALMRRRG